MWCVAIKPLNVSCGAYRLRRLGSIWLAHVDDGLSTLHPYGDAPFSAIYCSRRLCPIAAVDSNRVCAPAPACQSTYQPACFVVHRRLATTQLYRMRIVWVCRLVFIVYLVLVVLQRHEICNLVRIFAEVHLNTAIKRSFNTIHLNYSQWKCHREASNVDPAMILSIKVLYSFTVDFTFQTLTHFLHALKYLHKDSLSMHKCYSHQAYIASLLTSSTPQMELNTWSLLEIELLTPLKCCPSEARMPIDSLDRL